MAVHFLDACGIPESSATTVISSMLETHVSKAHDQPCFGKTLELALGVVIIDAYGTPSQVIQPFRGFLGMQSVSQRMACLPDKDF